MFLHVLRNCLPGYSSTISPVSHDSLHSNSSFCSTISFHLGLHQFQSPSSCSSNKSPSNTSVPAADVDLHVATVNWSELLNESAEALTELHSTLPFGNSLRHFPLRNVMVGIRYFSSATFRTFVHVRVARALAELRRRGGPTAPLVVIGWSLGTAIATDFFGAIQRMGFGTVSTQSTSASTCAKSMPSASANSPASASSSSVAAFASAASISALTSTAPFPLPLHSDVLQILGDSPLERGQTLSLFYTVGCPFAWMFPTWQPRVVRTRRWFNLYYASDFLAGPLRPLHSDYRQPGSGVTADVAVPVRFAIWNWLPLSHVSYITDSFFADHLAHHLRPLLLASDCANSSPFTISAPQPKILPMTSSSQTVSETCAFKSAGAQSQDSENILDSVLDEYDKFLQTQDNLQQPLSAEPGSENVALTPATSLSDMHQCCRCLHIECSCGCAAFCPTCLPPLPALPTAPRYDDDETMGAVTDSGWNQAHLLTNSTAVPSYVKFSESESTLQSFASTNQQDLKNSGSRSRQNSMARSSSFHSLNQLTGLKALFSSPPLQLRFASVSQPLSSSTASMPLVFASKSKSFIASSFYSAQRWFSSTNRSLRLSVYSFRLICRRVAAFLLRWIRMVRSLTLAFVTVRLAGMLPLRFRRQLMSLRAPRLLHRFTLTLSWLLLRLRGSLQLVLRQGLATFGTTLLFCWLFLRAGLYSIKTGVSMAPWLWTLLVGKISAILLRVVLFVSSVQDPLLVPCVVNPNSANSDLNHQQLEPISDSGSPLSSSHSVRLIHVPIANAESAASNQRVLDVAVLFVHGMNSEAGAEIENAEVFQKLSSVCESIQASSSSRVRVHFRSVNYACVVTKHADRIWKETVEVHDLTCRALRYFVLKSFPSCMQFFTDAKFRERVHVLMDSAMNDLHVSTGSDETPLVVVGFQHGTFVAQHYFSSRQAQHHFSSRPHAHLSNLVDWLHENPSQSASVAVQTTSNQSSPAQAVHAAFACKSPLPSSCTIPIHQPSPLMLPRTDASPSLIGPPVALRRSFSTNSISPAYFALAHAFRQVPASPMSSPSSQQSSKLSSKRTRHESIAAAAEAEIHLRSQLYDSGDDDEEHIIVAFDIPAISLSCSESMSQSLKSSELKGHSNLFRNGQTLSSFFSIASPMAWFVDPHESSWCWSRTNQGWTNIFYAVDPLSGPLKPMSPTLQRAVQSDICFSSPTWNPAAATLSALNSLYLTDERIWELVRDAIIRSSSGGGRCSQAAES